MRDIVVNAVGVSQWTIYYDDYDISHEVTEGRLRLLLLLLALLLLLPLLLLLLPHQSVRKREVWRA